MPQPGELRVKPQYGWGWTGTPSEPIRETPPPFRMWLHLAEPGRWAGIVITSGHEFDGMTVALAQRHYQWDGFVSLSVLDGDKLVTEGWAGIDDHSALIGKKVSLRRRLQAAWGAFRHRAMVLKKRLSRRWPEHPLRADGARREAASTDFSKLP